MPRDCSSSLKFAARTLIANVSPPLLPGLSRRCPRPDPADSCPDSEVVFASDANNHRKLHRRFEVRACPVAKRHKAKPLPQQTAPGALSKPWTDPVGLYYGLEP